MKTYYATRQTNTFNTVTQAYVEHTYSFTSAREAKAWVKGEESDGFKATYHGTHFPVKQFLNGPQYSARIHQTREPLK